MKTYKPQITIVAVIICCFLSACIDKSTIYRDHSLNLIEPVDIISWAMFADGGSIQITFKDSKGNALTLYYDLSGDGPKDNRNIYIGKVFPDHEGNKRVPIGSPVEKEIIKYVSIWMKSNFSDFSKDPNQMIMSSNGGIITSGAIFGLIQDLQKRNL